MNSAADLSGIFIVPDETALAFAPVINMRQAQRGKTSDWSIFEGKPPLIDQSKREKMTSICFGLL